MAEALWPREGLTTPREAVAAREAASPRRLSIAMPIPAHVGVVLGLATAGYAVTLAGVTALQSGADAAVAAARSPIGAAIDATAAGHDRLDAALGAAGQDYDAAAARYQAAADQLTAVEAQIDALASVTKAVDGATKALPTRLAMPSVVRSVSSGARATSTAHATSGGSAVR